ncbi:hypothetical protein TNIN_190371 [Trichonephila inaurata madagascariensis]|uniref:Uncharacterized protein n=1 Tax=Trichonephila inaurata madagascariensis TaxID=2747483 RepID=A0A8X7BSP2_9ARAC|nr:hypothetical protein TNIN_190371 [Trichonephila inaurata madagascariensis]
MIKRHRVFHRLGAYLSFCLAREAGIDGSLLGKTKQSQLTYHFVKCPFCSSFSLVPVTSSGDDQVGCFKTASDQEFFSDDSHLGSKELNLIWIIVNSLQMSWSSRGGGKF